MEALGGGGHLIRTTLRNNADESPLFAYVMRVHRPALVEHLLDAELTALMRCSTTLRAEIEADHAAWWHRFARQYEQWREFSATRAADEDAAAAVVVAAPGTDVVEAAAAAKKLVEKKAEETAQREFLARNWAAAQRNWRRFGVADTLVDAGGVATKLDDDANAADRPIPSTRYAEYRAWMLSSVGVRIAYAIVDCDRNRFFAWLPHDEIQGCLSARASGYNVTLPRFIERREAGVFRRQQAESERAAATAAAAATTARATTTSSTRAETPADAQSGSLDSRDAAAPRPLGGADRHIPFVYSTARRHDCCKSYRRAVEQVEFTGLSAKLRNMCKLALAGTAFCVHAVVLYGTNFDDAARRAVRQHTDAIECAAASRRGEGEDDDGGEADGRQRHPAARGDVSGAERVPDDSAAPAFDPIRRGDVPRQRDAGFAVVHPNANGWPIRHNLCARRVTALYNDVLYVGAQIDRSELAARDRPHRFGTLATETREADGRVTHERHLGFTMSLANLALSRDEVLERVLVGVANMDATVVGAMSQAIVAMLDIRGIVDPVAIGRHRSRSVPVLAASPLLPLFSVSRCYRQTIGAKTASSSSSSSLAAPTWRSMPASPFAVAVEMRSCAECGADNSSFRAQQSARVAHAWPCGGCARREQSDAVAAWGPSQSRREQSDAVAAWDPSQSRPARAMNSDGGGVSDRNDGKAERPQTAAIARNRRTLPLEYHGWCAKPAEFDHCAHTVTHAGDFGVILRSLDPDNDPDSADYGACRLP